VFEKSRFAAETGAALIISCNGARVLSRLGFSFERARGCNVKSWDTVDGITLTGLSSLNLENAETQFGAPLMSVHRVDLHNELLRLASTKEHTGGVGEVTLRLNSRVVGASAEEGRVELADGTVHHADLIVAADGVHSILRNVVLGCEAPAASVTGLSAFRFLIPTVDVGRSTACPILSREERRADSSGGHRGCRTRSPYSLVWLSGVGYLCRHPLK